LDDDKLISYHTDVI